MKVKVPGATGLWEDLCGIKEQLRLQCERSGAEKLHGATTAMNGGLLMVTGESGANQGHQTRRHFLSWVKSVRSLSNLVVGTPRVFLLGHNSLSQHAFPLI